MTDEDLEKFSIMVIGFFGKDPETRHKVIRQRVKDFIDGLRISSYSGVNDGNLRDQWGLLFHENAANSDLSITISKQEFIWPIIVALCNNGRRGYTIDGYDQSYVEEIMEEYDSVINYQKSRYELVTRITTAFDRYVIDSKAHRRSTEHNGFVNSSWQDYVEDFGLNILHDLEEREIVTKVIMLSILRREKVIKDIKKGVNLED